MVNYLITGVTGYIGSMVIKELDRRAVKSGEKIVVTAIVRDAAKANKVLAGEGNVGSNIKSCELTFVEGDITDVVMMNSIGTIDYIIHCAAPTTSAYMVSNPVETADSIVLGTRNVLEIARRQQVKGMVYISSMEVYGQVTDIGRPRSEEELGEIALDSARSCYSLGKRMTEHYCHIYQQEYGVPVMIARLAQTFGKGVKASDNRVYMQFARAVCAGEDIVLKTQGTSMGNYCAIEDTVAAIFCILENGTIGSTYNVVNEENTMMIKEMAELVADKFSGGKSKVRIEAEGAGKMGYAPETKLRLSGAKLRSLGWNPTKNLEQMYEDVIATIKRI